MRKSYILSFVAALSLVIGTVGYSDAAMAQVRASEPAAEVNEAGGSGALILIAGLALLVLVAVAAGGGGGEDRPVSP